MWRQSSLQAKMNLSVHGKTSKRATKIAGGLQGWPVTMGSPREVGCTCTKCLPLPHPLAQSGRLHENNFSRECILLNRFCAYTYSSVSPGTAIGPSKGTGIEIQLRNIVLRSDVEKCRLTRTRFQRKDPHAIKSSREPPVAQLGQVLSPCTSPTLCLPAKKHCIIYSCTHNLRPQPRILPFSALQQVSQACLIDDNLRPSAMALRPNIPPVTRILLGLILAISLLYNTARWTSLQAANGTPDAKPILVPYIALVPSQVLFYPWTLLTSVCVEQNIVTLLVNGATVLFGGRYFERAWGSKDFALVLLITSLIPNMLAIPTYIIWSAVTSSPARALTPITGGITVQATFLVAFKQMVPEHTVSVYKGVMKMRVKHFPAIFLAVNTLSGLLLGTDTALVLAWPGLLTSWTYLRFYKRQPDISGTTNAGGVVKGDASETFAFATFFPDVIQPPIAAVCNQMFDFLCTIKLCTPFSNEAVAMSNEHAAARGDGGLPTFVKQPRGLRGMSKREEAERRRALALKALDQRLNNPVRPAAGSNAVTPSVSQGQETLGQTEYHPDNPQRQKSIT